MAHTRVVIYTRWSPRPDKATPTETLEVQERAARDFARAKGYNVAQVVHDPASSGKDAQRPLLWEAVHALSKGMVLIVYRLDRLARDSRLAILIEIEVERRGARIMSVQDEGTATQDPQAQLMKTLLQAIAQYQRQITAGLTRAAMNNKLRQGTLKAGLPPYGYTRSPEGTLQPDPVTFPALQAVEAAHAKGQPIAEARRAALAALPPDRHLEHATVSRIYRRISQGNQPPSSTHTRTREAD